MQSALSAHKIPINTKTAFFRSVWNRESNFDVGGRVFLQKKNLRKRKTETQNIAVSIAVSITVIVIA